MTDRNTKKTARPDPAAGRLINVTPHENTLAVAVPLEVYMTPAAYDAVLPPHKSSDDDDRVLDRFLRNVSSAAETAGFHTVPEARCLFEFAGLFVRKSVAPDGTFVLTAATPAEAPPVDVTPAARRAGFSPAARVAMTPAAHRELFPCFGEPPEDDRRLVKFLADLHPRLVEAGFLWPDDEQPEFSYQKWVVTKDGRPAGRPVLLILTKRENCDGAAADGGRL